MKVRRIESILRESVASYDARRAVSDAGAAAELFAPLLESRAREGFAVLLLNARHRPIGLELVSEGTATGAIVHPREVFGAAVRMGAVAVICAHNHPSGDPGPSIEDRESTKRLVAAGKLLGIPLLDSLVIGGRRADGTLRYDSMRANGLAF